MKSVNEVILIGNMTRDPEVRQTQGGQNMAMMGVATNHDYLDGSSQKQSEVEFHNVVAWGKLAEFIGKYFKKGDAVYVTGRLRTRAWMDESSGAGKKYRTEIIARDVIQLRRTDGRASGGDGEEKEFVAKEKEVKSGEMPSIESDF